MSLGLNLGLQYKNHISGDSFDLSQLGLTLDLRSPIEVLTEDTRKSNGFVGMQDDLNPDDIGVIIDQSASKALTLIYASDFSAGVDGWSTLVESVPTGNIDGIAGEDDWLQMELTAVSGFQTIRRSGTTGAGTIKYFTFRYMIPSTNAACDGLRYMSGAATQGVQLDKRSVTPDVIHTMEGYYYQDSATTELRIYALDGSSTTIGAAGDKIYIKDFEIHSVAGHHFRQATFSAAARPHLDETTFTAFGDGTDDKMIMTNITNWKTAVSGDTAGMFSFMFYDVAGAGVETRLEGFGNTAGTGHCYIMRITTGNLFTFSITDNSFVTSSLSYNVTAFRGGWMKIQIGSDGSNYYFYINGTLVAHSETLNHPSGSWLSILAPAVWNIFTLFQNRVGTSYPLKLRALQYISGRVFTPSEIALINSSPLYTAP
jgi:hypothetical protein